MSPLQIFTGLLGFAIMLWGIGITVRVILKAYRRRRDAPKPVESPRPTTCLRVYLKDGTTWDAPPDREDGWYRAKAGADGTLHVSYHHPYGSIVTDGFAAGTWLKWEDVVLEGASE